MVLAGKIWKHKNHYLIEIPLLDLMTQGRTKTEAFQVTKRLRRL